LDDDGRGHHCGARVYGFCILSKQEWAGQRIEPGTGIHPNRTAKGYAGIRIGWRAAEGEREMTDEDESTDPGIIAAAERAILKFLRDREANEAIPSGAQEDRGTSTVNELAEHPAPANPVKQTKTVEELAAMIHQDLSQIEGCPKQGVKVTVYGLNPWNCLLTFGVDAGPVRNRAELQGFCDIITERLKRLYDVGGPHVEG
jgi:hypothetical protein